jgi:cell filamentation protein
VPKSTKPKSTTSFRDTSFGIIPRSEVISLEKEGVTKALEHVLKLGSNKTQISPKIVLQVHKVGFGWIFPKWGGKYRIIQVEVGAYEPPYYSRVPELVQNLCEDLNERLDHLPSMDDEEYFLDELVSLLAWFQHSFVLIHPFNDYNGRVARLLTNLVALNLDLPIFEIKAETGKDREAYIEAVKAADHHDLSKLEKLIASALEESLKI